MKIVVFEPGHSGHRLHYVSLMLSAIADLGLRPVFATTKQALQSDDYRGHIGNITSEFDVFEVPDILAKTTSGIVDAKNRFKMFDQFINELKPDHLLIPTIEALFPALMWQVVARRKFTSAPPFIEGLFFSPGHGYRFKNIRRQILNPIIKYFSRRLRIDVYAHADPFQLADIRQPNSRINYVVMPDPVPDPPSLSQNECRKRLGIPTEGRYIAICGGISLSKGVHELLDAFAGIADSISPTDRILLAGPFTEETRNYIRSNFQPLVEQKRIVCIDRSLFGDEFSYAFNALDLNCAVQRGRPGSSSTLIRAANAGKPTLARDQFWSGRAVRQFGLGWSAKTWLKDDFCQSLKKCLDELDQFQFNSVSKKYLAFHRDTNFQAVWTARIRERLNMPGNETQLDWDDVLREANL